MEDQIQAIKHRYGIVGASAQLNYAIETAMRVAPTDLTVLITGESGTGKEFFSQMIHHLSQRKHKNFIAVNCGAIPEGTIDSELFGHEKGSFTGALDMRKGYFEVTDGGTIFLDEIGEMPMPTQARLLRVLENGEYIRVGSSKVMKTDVRVIAATNVNLFDAVEKGKFREDLFFRLSNVPIKVPPLRDRGTDIELLFRKFAQDFADKYHTKPLSLTPEARTLLIRYRFPGNVRQLKNIAEQISALEINRTIDADTLVKYLPELGKSSVPMLSPSRPTEGQTQQSFGFAEREMLYKMLFEIRQDVKELKETMNAYLSTGQSSVLRQTPLLQSVFRENTSNQAETEIKRLIVDEDSELEITTMPRKQNPTDFLKDEELPRRQPEHLSLEIQEKELIRKALIKNHHKRKNAALELGISERTLYRKIKQYDLEDN